MVPPLLSVLLALLLLRVAAGDWRVPLPGVFFFIQIQMGTGSGLSMLPQIKQAACGLSLLVQWPPPLVGRWRADFLLIIKGGLRPRAMAQVAQRYLCNLLAQQPSNHSTWSLAQILWKLIIRLCCSSRAGVRVCRRPGRRRPALRASSPLRWRRGPAVVHLHYPSRRRPRQHWRRRQQRHAVRAQGFHAGVRWCGAAS